MLNSHILNFFGYHVNLLMQVLADKLPEVLDFEKDIPSLETAVKVLTFFFIKISQFKYLVFTDIVVIFVRYN